MMSLAPTLRDAIRANKSPDGPRLIVVTWIETTATQSGQGREDKQKKRVKRRTKKTGMNKS